MKLASFEVGGADRIGFAVSETELVSLTEAAKLIGRADDCPRNMIELIEQGDSGLALARAAEAALRAQPQAVTKIAIASVTWHPPVRRPLKIVCLALNNSANADRIIKGPSMPALFIKTASSLIGHDGAIECREEYGRVHPEPELAIVIGKKARNVLPQDSMDHIFGYSIFNDITSPTMRQQDTFHYRAIHPKNGNPDEIEYVDSWVSYSGRYKGSDTFGCLGPWIVTKDEIDDPHDLDVTCRHRDRLVTQDNTRNLFHKTKDVIAFVSRYMTLDPGDVIAMGTALKKSAAGGAIQNIDLNRLGGPISITIEKIGTLSNRVTHIP